MKRVLLSLPDNLLAATDKEAKFNYMTRSELLRRALIWYLRPAARSQRENGAISEAEPEPLYTDPEELLHILQHQKASASVRAMLRDMKQSQATARNNRRGTN